MNEDDQKIIEISDLPNSLRDNEIDHIEPIDSSTTLDPSYIIHLIRVFIQQESKIMHRDARLDQFDSSTRDPSSSFPSTSKAVEGKSQDFNSKDNPQSDHAAREKNPEPLEVKSRSSNRIASPDDQNRSTGVNSSETSMNYPNSTENVYFIKDGEEKQDFDSQTRPIPGSVTIPMNSDENKPESRVFESVLSSIEKDSRAGGSAERDLKSVDDRNPNFGTICGQSQGQPTDEPEKRNDGKGEASQITPVQGSNHELESLNMDRDVEFEYEKEDSQEEAGCLLWDLAANLTHANFLVQNMILDVILNNLQISDSKRICEISLGILGNLVCHEITEKEIIKKEELTSMILKYIFVEDPPCLIETFRLLSAGLHSKESKFWSKLLNSDEILTQILWVANNTVNESLLEKSTELVLAMVDGNKGNSLIFLPRMFELNFLQIIIEIISNEINHLSSDISNHSDVILDNVLQITEVISISEEYAKVLANNKRVFTLACHIIKLSYMEEIHASALTAIVLIANLLSEDKNLIAEISNDSFLLPQFFSLIPRCGEDCGIRNAMWSILGHIFRRVQESIFSSDDASMKSHDIALIVDTISTNADSIIFDLEDHVVEDMNGGATTVPTSSNETSAEEGVGPNQDGRGMEKKLATVERMVQILRLWTQKNVEPLLPNGIVNPKLKDVAESSLKRLQNHIAKHSSRLTIQSRFE